MSHSHLKFGIPTPPIRTVQSTGGQSPRDWDHYRPVIEQLYRGDDKTLKDVMQIMQAEFEFQATPKMFKHRITQWGLEKKRKGSEMAAARRIINRRRLQGKATDISIRGERITEAKVLKYEKRKSQPKKLEPEELSDAPTPPSVIYSTPKLAPALPICRELGKPVEWELEGTLDLQAGGWTSHLSTHTRKHGDPHLQSSPPSLRAVLSLSASCQTPLQMQGVRHSASAIHGRAQILPQAMRSLIPLSVSFDDSSVERSFPMPRTERIISCLQEYYSNHYFKSEHWEPWVTETPEEPDTVSAARKSHFGQDVDPGRLAGTIEVADRLFSMHRMGDAGQLLDHACQMLKPLLLQQHPQFVPCLLLITSLGTATTMPGLVEFLMKQLFEMSQVVLRSAHPISRLIPLLARTVSDSQMLMDDLFSLLSKLYQRSMGDLHPQYLYIAYNYAWSLLRQNRVDDALSMFQILRGIYETYATAEDYPLRQILYSLSEGLQSCGKYEEAEQILVDIGRRIQLRFGPDHANVMRVECLRSRVHVRLQLLDLVHVGQAPEQDREEMLGWLEEALIVGSRTMDRLHPTMLLLQQMLPMEEKSGS